MDITVIQLAYNASRYVGLATDIMTLAFCCSQDITLLGNVESFSFITSSLYRLQTAVFKKVLKICCVFLSHTSKTHAHASLIKISTTQDSGKTLFFHRERQNQHKMTVPCSLVALMWKARDKDIKT